jgi:vancomycin resistance protein YoaR
LPLYIGAGLLVVILGAFGISRAVAAGRIIGSVKVDGLEIGGLTAGEANSALVDLENTLAGDPAMFSVEGTSLELEPITVGFDLDEEAMIDVAMRMGRTGSLPEQFWWWLTHLFRPGELNTIASLDSSALETVLSAWDVEAVGDPPFHGGVVVEGTTPAAAYPRAGHQIDRTAAPSLILDEVRRRDRSIMTLPVVAVHPRLTNEDIDQGVEEAQLILAGPVTLSNAEREKQVRFSVADIAGALRSQIRGDEIVFRLDPDSVEAVLEPLKAELEDEPVDARLEVEGDFVTVVPGRRGTVINPDVTAQNLLLAASSAARVGTFPIDESADPEITTEDLEELGIQHKVSQFTTYHACCQNRVSNIHLIADKVSGVIVQPGATFSLNETVGERTSELGYLEDGAIVGGRLEPEIGGGVSQFATTFYNAVFWGGYEDISHKPHSFYFSRYPLGIEATISWPGPDVQFLNNTENAILIQTSYSNTSITVSLFSNNDGRIVYGEQSEGRLRINVSAEGGPQARIVTAHVSEPYNHRDPPPPRYIGDETIIFPEQKEDQAPAQGFTVDVTRTVTVGSSSQVDQWKVVYSPRQQIFLVHPCQIEGSGVSCPSTTTVLGGTTTPPTTVP